MTPNANHASATRCPRCGAALPCHPGTDGTPEHPHCGCCDPHHSRHCEPPQRCPDPGTVDVPQDQPPPKVKVQPQRPGQDPGRPARNTPADLGWFRDQVRGTLSDGPRFGPRKDEYLPFLLVRSSAGDAGGRPFNGVFWESPDIFVVPGVEAAAAPLMPATVGGVARAGAPNTLYAQVWNLGKAPAYRVRVEFYWFNPSLGISRADAHLIGATWVDLGNRFTRGSNWTEVRGPAGAYLSLGSHVMVRCPTTWVPEYVNNGHECLVVRVSEPMMDAVAPAQFSAAADRHVAQRNIAVITSSSPAQLDLALDLGYLDHTGLAEIEVVTEDANAMDWLKLYANARNAHFAAPAQPVVAGLLPVQARGARLLDVAGLGLAQRAQLLRPRETVQRGCDPLVVQLHAGIADMKPGEAAVVRVRQRVGGVLVGGYTAVLVGK
ncbi:MAG: hypothetical protein JSR23_01920 [Proteobacteria bacterium]|nr:hypothetical protein [Pseudomonadota bacterium]